jgi:hypothetical protein
VTNPDLEQSDRVDRPDGRRDETNRRLKSTRAVRPRASRTHAKMPGAVGTHESIDAASDPGYHLARRLSARGSQRLAGPGSVPSPTQ